MAPKTALSQPHPVFAEKARQLLQPFRNRFPGGIDCGIEYADRLEQAICEALVEAHNDGVGEGMGH